MLTTCTCVMLVALLIPRGLRHLEVRGHVWGICDCIVSVNDMAIFNNNV